MVFVDGEGIVPMPENGTYSMLVYRCSKPQSHWGKKVPLKTCCRVFGGFVLK